MLTFTNCSSGSNLPWAPVAGVLAVSLAIHAIAAPHDLGHPQLPQQEHIELSSKSTAAVSIYGAGFAIANSGSTFPSTGQAIRY